MGKNKIRKLVFWPPLILLCSVLVINIINEKLLIDVFSYLNSLFMEKMGWLASMLAMLCLILLIVCIVTPFGNVRLGGKNAKPTMSNFNWFAIVLTSCLASGVLIWSYVEPICHLQDPATALTGIEPMTGAAAKFALETVYMHWSILPYAIYTLPTVVFGFMIYNAKAKYSVSSQLAPMLGKANTSAVQSIIDMLVLFCIGLGMAACFGQGLLNMIGCFNALFGTGFNNTLLFIFASVIGAIAIFTAITGIQKGVKTAARINIYGYYFIFAFILITGPTAYILGMSTECVGGFMTHFFERAMYTGTSVNSDWPQSWTSFYWACQMAWAPTTAMFLATVSYGRKIKHMIITILIGCSCSAIVMTSILSSTTIYVQMQGIADVIGAFNANGMGAAPYAVLETLPGHHILLVVLAGVIILTLVTAVNANIIAMSGMSHERAQDDTGKDLTPWYTKVIWGVIICAMAYIAMALLGGFDGVKTMSNIGGIVATILMIGICISVVKLITGYQKYDVVDNENESTETVKESVEQ